jgi:hypothetical protein
MSGIVIPLMAERVVDFSGLSSSGLLDHVLAQRIPVHQWRQMALIVRIHSLTINGTDGFSVEARLDSFTPEDPTIVWLSFNQNAGSVFINSSTPSPTLLRVPIQTIGPAAWASYGAVVARCNSGHTSGLPLRATISLSLEAKDA